MQSYDFYCPMHDVTWFSTSFWLHDCMATWSHGHLISPDFQSQLDNMITQSDDHTETWYELIFNVSSKTWSHGHIIGLDFQCLSDDTITPPWDRVFPLDFQPPYGHMITRSRDITWFSTSLWPHDHTVTWYHLIFNVFSLFLSTYIFIEVL